MNLNMTYTNSEINNYQFANNSPWHKNVFTGLNSPRLTIGLHWHPLRKPVPTGAVHRVRCVCISNRVHLCDVDPQAHICDVNPHTDTDWSACGCGTTVEADSHTRLAFSCWMMYWVRCDERSRTKFELLWIQELRKALHPGESPK